VLIIIPTISQNYKCDHNVLIIIPAISQNYKCDQICQKLKSKLNALQKNLVIFYSDFPTHLYLGHGSLIIGEIDNLKLQMWSQCVNNNTNNKSELQMWSQCVNNNTNNKSEL
jgi:hypothetical protein